MESKSKNKIFNWQIFFFDKWKMYAFFFLRLIWKIQILILKNVKNKSSLFVYDFAFSSNFYCFFLSFFLFVCNLYFLKVFIQLKYFNSIKHQKSQVNFLFFLLLKKKILSFIDSFFWWLISKLVAVW